MGPASLLTCAPGPKRRSAGWQLRHEGVTSAVESGVEGAGGGWKVGGGEPRHVGATTRVHREAIAGVVVASRSRPWAHERSELDSYGIDKNECG
jgi:hypothetical protein